VLTAIAGINWGDEGKGRMVDLLSQDYGVIVRYQGGNNAGHTVINERGKFVLNLLPSGILREDTVNVMGTGMVVDLAHLNGEIDNLNRHGVSVTPERLKISDRAVVCFPYHRTQDILEEERLGDKKFGSTRRGIAPVYADKYMKKAVRMGDLLCPDTWRERLTDILSWKNLTLVGGYRSGEVTVDDCLRWLETHARRLAPFVCDTTHYLADAAARGENILFEAQLGALRDIDFGIYPYTTSSQTVAAYAPTGAGIPAAKLDCTVGVMKAYSSCVGEGPFTVEMFGDEAARLREAGGEYGAATGRPRRVGAFDAVASRYGVTIQGADCLALTKLDVLSYMEKIPICTAYEVDGVRTTQFPVGQRLERARPVYDYMDGFQRDISACRDIRDLPEEAVAYVRRLEEAVGCPIRYLSVGPARGDCVVIG
jgi:adenylosuccinate synthase